MRPLREKINPESLHMIGIPRFMCDKSIEDFDTCQGKYIKIKTAVKEYLTSLDEQFENNRGVTFYGSNGTGKSFLASLIIKEAYRFRYSAYRITFAEYINLYTRTWDARSKDEREGFESDLYKYKSAEFLALEEVGKEIDNSISTPVLEDLLRYREDKGLPIIICMNLCMSDVEARYGASICSLIKGNTMPIQIEGEDRREEYFKKRG